MSWQPEDFLIATAGEPFPVVGYVYRGLGLHKPSPRRKNWSLTHLGTGHQIATITGKVADVFPVASEIAECGDWDFDGLKGYVNRDPEIGKRLHEIIARHKNARPAIVTEARKPNHDVARQITERRAS